MNIVICIAVTKKGESCKNKAKEGKVCGVHKNYKIEEIKEVVNQENIINQEKVVNQENNVLINTEVKEINIDYKKLGMNLIFQDTNGSLALLKGKFQDEKLALDAYFSIANNLLVNPLIKTPYGKEGKQNRSIGFTSDTSIGYKYSNQMIPSIKLSEKNRELLNYVNNYLGTDYNAILWNRYAPVSDYLSQHSDDESALANMGVFSITLWIDEKGEIIRNISKAFRITNKPLESDKASFRRTSDQISLRFEDGKIQNFSGKQKIMDIMLEHGNSCLMFGSFQKYLMHGIPLSKKVKYTRISATFRKHLI